MVRLDSGAVGPLRRQYQCEMQSMCPIDMQASSNRTTTQRLMIGKQNNSTGVNVPDIQSLNLRVEELGGSVDWWNNAIIVSLVFAAVAAIAVGITTYVAFEKANLLAKAERAWSEAKDSQVQIDLKNKDIEIANANERAAKAQEEAAKANLELEKIRTPRTISAQGQSEMIAALKSYAGTPYDLCVGTDAESVDLMKTLQSVLNNAGWNQVPVKGAVGISDSVPLVGITLNTGIFVEMDISKVSVWHAPVNKLVGLLKAKNIASQGTGAATGVNPNAVHIIIGKKPS